MAESAAKGTTRGVGRAHIRQSFIFIRYIPPPSATMVESGTISLLFDFSVCFYSKWRKCLAPFGRVGVEATLVKELATTDARFDRERCETKRSYYFLSENIPLSIPFLPISRKKCFIEFRIPVGMIRKFHFAPEGSPDCRDRRIFDSEFLAL